VFSPDPSLRTQLGRLELAHPLVNGSGTLDALVAGTLGLAAFVTKTVTPMARAGNPPPRIVETPAGMLNSIGLANPGLERFCDEVLPQLAELRTPLVVSVGGFSHDDYARCVARFSAQPAVAAIELNVSCPNVESGCISIGSEPAETRSLLQRLSALTDQPLLAKLTPNVADVAPIALAAAEGGASGLVVANTLRGIAIDRRTLRPLLGGSGGGLSGPALKPVALHAVGRAYEATRLPIVGSGGAASAQDCVEVLAAGASAVALGTALFVDPGLPSRILAELPALLAAHGATAVENLVGRSWTRDSIPLLEGDVRVP
jgi:dihydroorotate dehydrogenase (NAD+) catalytic subunit